MHSKAQAQNKSVCRLIAPGTHPQRRCQPSLHTGQAPCSGGSSAAVLSLDHCMASGWRCSAHPRLSTALPEPCSAAHSLWVAGANTNMRAHTTEVIHVILLVLIHLLVLSAPASASCEDLQRRLGIIMSAHEGQHSCYLVQWLVARHDKG